MCDTSQEKSSFKFPDKNTNNFINGLGHFASPGISLLNQW